MIGWLRHWLGGWRAPVTSTGVRCDEVASFPSCPEFAADEWLAVAWGGPAHTPFRRGG